MLQNLTYFRNKKQTITKTFEILTQKILLFTLTKLKDFFMTIADEEE